MNPLRSYLRKMPVWAVVGVVALLLGDSAQAQPAPVEDVHDVFQTVPADAPLALILPNLKELKERGDKLVEETQIQTIRFSQAVQWAAMSVQISKGVDFNGGFAAFVGERKLEKSRVPSWDRAVFVVPYTDLDQMGENFGLEKGTFKLGEIHAHDGPNGKRFVLARPGFGWVCRTKAELEEVARRKPLSETLDAEALSRQRRQHVLLQAHVEGMSWMVDELTEDLTEKLLEETDPAERKAVAEAAAGLKGVERMEVGCRVEQGLIFDYGMSVNVDAVPEAKKLLDLIRRSTDASLYGLPEGSVLAAHAFQGGGRETSAAANALFRVALKHRVWEEVWGKGQSLHDFGAVKLVTGLFADAWRRLHGYRAAVYHLPVEKNAGFCTILAAVDVDDAPGYVEELLRLGFLVQASGDPPADAQPPSIVRETARAIAELGDDDYATRESASSRLRLFGEPALAELQKATASADRETARRAKLLVRDISREVEHIREAALKGTPAEMTFRYRFHRAAERRDGRDVHVVLLEPTTPNPTAEMALTSLLGPHWKKLRMAVYDRRILLSIGSDPDLFDAALVAQRTNAVGLAARPSLEPPPTGERRKFLFHLAASDLDSALTPFLGLPQPAPADAANPVPLARDSRTTLEAFVGPRSIRLRTSISTADLKSARRRFGW